MTSPTFSFLPLCVLSFPMLAKPSTQSLQAMAVCVLLLQIGQRAVFPVGAVSRPARVCPGLSVVSIRARLAVAACLSACARTTSAA